MVQKPTVVEVSCLWQASYLLALGFPLENTVRKENGFTVFVFPSKDTTAAIRDFVNDQATVNPKRLMESWRTLKALCR